MNNVQVHPTYADVETSSEDYAGRFTGETGKWLLSVQEKILLELLEGETGTVLDVGGGNGQIAGPLASRGYKVTIIGSAPECANRLKDIPVTFVVGDLLKIPFPDKSFDIVTCFRFLPHCEEWKILVKELCRVAKKTVIVDYPTLQSINAFSPLLFKLKKKIEINTRTYTLFWHEEINRSFNNCSFNLSNRKGEFFLPMVIHRVLKKPKISAILEGVFNSLGINRFLGSPVIVKYQREL